MNEILAITPAGAERVTAACRLLAADPEAARKGRALFAPRPKMQVDGTTALIALQGVLMRGAGALGELLGACDPAEIQAEVEAAAADPSVQRIVLAVDSPGGSVAGIAQCADAVFAAAQAKDVVAVIDPMGCSAAYWIASAASAILLADETSTAGSIGVIATHLDRSGAIEAAGYKVTEITSGRYKAAASPNRPLSADGRDQMQTMVDQTHAIFQSAVARGRGFSQQEATSVSDGRIFQGQAAVAAGLADGIGTLEAVLAQPPRRMQTSARPPATGTQSGAAASDPLAVAAKAREYIDAQAALGNTVSAADAVRHVVGQTSSEVAAPQLAEHKPPRLAQVTLDPRVAAAWARAYIDQQDRIGNRVSPAEAVREFHRREGK